jgi:hypothetical protein
MCAVPGEERRERRVRNPEEKIVCEMIRGLVPNKRERRRRKLPG